MADKISSGSLTEADIPMLRAMREAATSANRPVTPAKAMELLERLFQHYPPKALNADAQKAAWIDWLEDVADLPEDVLADACRAWRRADNRFAPSPGQLLALVDRSYQADERLIDLAIRHIQKTA